MTVMIHVWEAAFCALGDLFVGCALDLDFVCFIIKVLAYEELPMTLQRHKQHAKKSGHIASDIGSHWESGRFMIGPYDGPFWASIFPFVR
ncbi:unnamed protein product [Sphenostylis stenocarpa]|uniref:Uncharacterized protein n=1 Tax=Sphenostylis stenocarpa TaxID=92480 RepID=A0AA86SF86_9FABA|nr:unnamed protein product [Sphenostylis stenocarpa]